MKQTTLFKLTYFYLALPLLIFCAMWLDYGIAGIALLLLGYALWMSVKDISEEKGIPCSACGLYTLFLIALLWCFLAGIGYFYYQSNDYHFRNAVFRDLIFKEWPVFYKNADTPMVYYMGFWLFPALATKICSFLITNTSVLFLLGNLILLFYATCGVWLIFIHLSLAVKSTDMKQILWAILLFIFFSGADIIGNQFFSTSIPPFDHHLEWWSIPLQYSSFTTEMFWVFNQFIPITLITLLTYNQRKIRIFGLLGAFSFFASPYPTAGLAVLMLAYAGSEFYKSKNKILFLKKEIFSSVNLVSLFFLGLIFSYFITNSNGIDRFTLIFEDVSFKQWLIFILLEFGLYGIVLLTVMKKDVFFITSLVELVLISLLRLDVHNNFCMRASLPALVILAISVINFLIHSSLQKQWLPKSLLIILFLYGIATPEMEFYRSFYYIHKEKKLNVVSDGIYTLDKKYVLIPPYNALINNQFTAKNYKTDFFWQVLSRKIDY